MPLLVGDCQEQFIVGAQPSTDILITDVNGVPTDTNSVTFEVKQPDGTTVSASVLHPGIGSYFAVLPVLTQSGIHHWKATASGLINQVQQGSFRVVAQEF